MRQLEAFVAVAEERNFTRAAARLYVAQSGLSATIRSLEREMEAPLFVRSTRRVDLTVAGTTLLPEARRTLAAARAAADAVAAVEGLERGTLTVGVMQSIWVIGFSALLARYRAAYPGIALKLEHTTSLNLLDQLREGAIDLIVATIFGQPPPEIAWFPVFRSPFVIVDRADGVLAGRKSVTLNQLTHFEQVGFPPKWGIRILADQMMHSANMETRVDFEVNDTHTLLDLVDAGLGIAIIPQELARLRSNLRVVTIRGARCDWTIAAQSLAPTPANPAARALWDMLRPDTL